MICLNNGESELVIKRSRFIAYARHIEDREQAKAAVEELRAMHPEARHVCHAFIADERGDDFGYSDDGEPGGTAGKPIYTALAAAEARKSMIIVVRYFGGIKLGAGGLTRAYRDSAVEVIQKAGLVSAVRYAEYAVEIDGDAFRRAAGILRDMGCRTDNIVYNKRVSFTALAPADADISSALSFLGASVQKRGERYVPEQ